LHRVDAKALLAGRGIGGGRASLLFAAAPGAECVEAASI
jgi:hypothetical protein